MFVPNSLLLASESLLLLAKRRIKQLQTVTRASSPFIFLFQVPWKDRYWIHLFLTCCTAMLLLPWDYFRHVTVILVMCFSIIMGEGTALECMLVPNAPSCCLKYPLMHLTCEGELKIHSHLSLVREQMVLFLRYRTQGF